MAELVEFPDPVLRAIAYVDSRMGADASIEPRPPAHEGLWVQVHDTGGDGVRDWVFQWCRLTFDVSHEDVGDASAAARRLKAWIDVWPLQETDVERDPAADRDRPKYFPLEDPRVPAYTLTVNLAFRGATVELPDRA